MSQAKTNPVSPHGEQQQPQRRPSSLNKPLLPRSSGDSRDYGSSSGGGGTQIHYNPPDTVTWSGPGATNQGPASATNQLSGPGSHGVSMNKYATKKSYSQGLFTLALFINNVAALRAAIAQIDAGNAGTTVYIYAALMVTSILLQAVTGAAVVYLGRTDMNTAHQERARRSERLNHIVALLSFVITLVNAMAHGLYSSRGGYPGDENQGVDPSIVYSSPCHDSY